MAYVMQAMCHLTSAEQSLSLWCRPASDMGIVEVWLPARHTFAEEAGNLSALDLPGLCGRLGG